MSVYPSKRGQLMGARRRDIDDDRVLECAIGRGITPLQLGRRLGISTNAARKRLRGLVYDGKLERRPCCGGGYLYYHPDT